MRVLIVAALFMAFGANLNAQSPWHGDPGTYRHMSIPMPKAPVTADSEESSGGSCIAGPGPCSSATNIKIDVIRKLKRSDCKFGLNPLNIRQMAIIQTAACNHIDQSKAYRPRDIERLCNDIHEAVRNDPPPGVSQTLFGHNLKTSESNCKKPVGDKNTWFSNHFEFHVDENAAMSNANLITPRFSLCAMSGDEMGPIRYIASASRAYPYKFQLGCRHDGKRWKAHEIMIQATEFQSESTSNSISVGVRMPGTSIGSSVTNTSSTRYNVEHWNGPLNIDELNATCGGLADQRADAAAVPLVSCED